MFLRGICQWFISLLTILSSQPNLWSNMNVSESGSCSQYLWSELQGNSSCSISEVGMLDPSIMQTARVDGRS
ncbi:hypothetical protein PVAP13_2KG281116 [Panicum virgatum]|uniref:Secreted protein n=1 Tax=Panicum virgatum TaxID=38727 RepID=A0A8T0WC43_PANVG|nr:hypothetical protein PVAP13_2KG282874 [Panicum virgatum]KAG2642323.1 hypothetical protein PVAP13_2KG281116 [Panicum virgatum]